jgi:hypothetical protein
MNMHHKVKGITLIGFAIMLCVLGFFAYMAMRLIPIYMEYFGVVKTMEQIRQDGSANKSLDEIRRSMNLKFDTQYVDTANVPLSAITLTREGSVPMLRVAYERRTPFVYNIDFVVSFDKSVNLVNAGGE